MELADSHCHIDFPDYEATAGELINAARQADVRYMLNISVCLEDFPQVLAVARMDPDIRATVGVHPNYDGVEEPTADRLVALADDPEVVGIGETGLDFYRHSVEPEDQRARFRAHIEAARRTGLPIIVHSRAAEEATIELVAEAAAAGVTGVMHCFAGGEWMARQALDHGFYISLAGIVTFKNAASLREVAAWVPSDRLLVETDSPYLAPEPYRGKTNQPAYVRHTAERLAEVREEPLEELAAATTANYRRLFGLDG